MNGPGWGSCEAAVVAAERAMYRLTVDGRFVAQFAARCGAHALNHARKHYGPLFALVLVGREINAKREHPGDSREVVEVPAGTHHVDALLVLAGLAKTKGAAARLCWGAKVRDWNDEPLMASETVELVPGVIVPLVVARVRVALVGRAVKL